MKLNWTIQQPQGSAHVTPEISYFVRAINEEFAAEIQMRTGMNVSPLQLGLFDSFEKAQAACEVDADQRLKP